jgi:hypothetical protein
MSFNFARAAEVALNVTQGTEVADFSRAMDVDPRGRGAS